MYKLVSVVKYCISNKLTVNDFFLSFSNIIHCSLVYQLYQLYLHYIDSERPLPLVCYCHRIASTCLSSVLYSQHWTQVHCDWILFLELDSGYSPFTDTNNINIMSNMLERVVFVCKSFYFTSNILQRNVFVCKNPYFTCIMLERVVFVCKSSHFIHNILERIVFVCKSFYFTSNILERVLFVFH